MRFQSNSTFNKLTPDFVADAYGPATFVWESAVNGPSDVTALPGPPAGQMYQIFTMMGYVPTTTTSTTAYIAFRTGGGIAIIYQPALVSGTVINWVGYLPWNGSLLFTNATPTNGGLATVTYRIVSISGD